MFSKKKLHPKYVDSTKLVLEQHIFNRAGTYIFNVKNPDGKVSFPQQFTVNP